MVVQLCARRMLPAVCGRLTQRRMASVPAKLQGKVAVVTAATDGIGLAVAKRLAEDGARVLISSRKQENVDRAVKELQEKNLVVEGCVCHASSSEHRQKMLEVAENKFGGVDILVSNVGVNPHFGPLLDITESKWDKTFDTNVKSTFFLIKEVAPYMEKRGGGSIILMSSISSYLLNPLALGVYSISKLSVIGVAKAVAPECADKGIRVNVLCPGLIKTNFSQVLMEDQAKTDALVDMFIPQRRLGLPEDISGAASFLASDDSRYMTGETMIISGGMSSHI